MVRLIGIVLALAALLSFEPPAFARIGAATEATGASTDATKVCRPGSVPMTRTELIFGTQRPRLPPVSGAAWRRFVAREIAPRFPDGFTLLNARGEWRGRRGGIRETSHILIVWHGATPQQQDKFEVLRSIYKQRFRQQSVLRIDGSDCVSF